MDVNACGRITSGQCMEAYFVVSLALRRKEVFVKRLITLRLVLLDGAC